MVTICLPGNFGGSGNDCARSTIAIVSRSSSCEPKLRGHRRKIARAIAASETI